MGQSYKTDTLCPVHIGYVMYHPSMYVNSVLPIVFEYPILKEHMANKCLNYKFHNNLV